MRGGGGSGPPRNFAFLLATIFLCGGASRWDQYWYWPTGRPGTLCVGAARCELPTACLYCGVVGGVLWSIMYSVEVEGGL